MAYFSNGTEGQMFTEDYCCHCYNYRDLGDGRGRGCPIYDIHLTYNYDQFKNDKVKEMLRYFINDKKECQMFLNNLGNVDCYQRMGEK